MNAVVETQERKRKVFVTQETLRQMADGTLQTKFDLSDLGRFGEVVTMFGHGPIALMTRSMRDGFAAQLSHHGYVPEEDYIVTIGDNTIGTCLGYFIGKLWPESGCINVLRFDKRRQIYQVVSFSV